MADLRRWGREPRVPVRLGLRANAGQFALLVGVNALVGGMLGQERTVVPLLAEGIFGITAVTASTAFIASFGLAKAFTNLVAGALADRFGRRPVLIAGWLLGVPVPIVLLLAPSWGWIVAANALLGVSQGLAWSATVVMKIDLVGPARRGLATGLNEFAGYTAVAVTALATGWLAERWGLGTAPFVLGLAYAGLGFGLSLAFVRETARYAELEVEPTVGEDPRLTTREVVALTTFREPTLSSCSQAGLASNLNDAAAWGLFPILFASAGLSVARIGVLVALYPAAWGLGQPLFGALSDRVGRKPLIVGGMWVQASGLALVAGSGGTPGWAAGALVLGVGTAMTYPTLLAAVGDVASPAWRASALGVYRWWRDAGFAFGAILSGIAADVVGLRSALWVVAALTAVSGSFAWTRMRESRGRAPLAAGRPSADP